MSLADIIKLWKGKRKISDVEYHLLHHLDEVKGLLVKKDEHRFAEMVDLVVLIRIYFKFSRKKFSNIKKDRLRKFKEKIMEDVKDGTV